MARLVIFDESVRGIDLPMHPVILGRSRKADIPIHDHLLSRKHCTIMPAGAPPGSGHKLGATLRLVDLKSSNGTFLNGSRIERSDLQFDDIIEIGNTVMVLLDTDTWKRGEGLTRLRNPVKAQELIQKIKMRADQEKNGSKGAPGGFGRNLEHGSPEHGSMASQGRRRASLRQKRTLTPSEAAFFEWARKEWLALPTAKDLLKDYVAHQVVSLMVRHSPELEDIISSVMERVLVPDAFGSLEKLGAIIEGALRDVLATPGVEARAELPEPPVEAP